MLTEARFKFALESLRQCMLLEPKGNVFFSPHLLYQNLLVVYFGAQSDTDLENDLKRALYIPADVSKAVVKQFYCIKGHKQFCYRIEGILKTFSCRIFSRLLITCGKGIYLDTENLFTSGHRMKEMTIQTNPELVRNYINNTIKSVTQGNIQNVLAPTSIDNGTDVVSFDAIYCKGIFVEKLEQLEISDSDVTDSEDENHENSNDKSKTFQTKLDVDVMEVLFAQDKISTYFLFPSRNSESNENNLTNNERLLQLMERLATEEGSQELHKLLDEGVKPIGMMVPTFKIEQNLRIYELLDKLHLEDLTPLGFALLHEFTDEESLKLGDALHRVNLEVTMDGLTATACNMFFSENNCHHAKINTSTSVTFPFICFIYDKSHRNVLFCGAMLES
ncbi:serpin B5 [Solenopsis invicta]|uniref:serpin B5 n=1 Tax=Solenopsis invicta TaxID=13686 RepID=UPI00193E7ACD|nr:serpin B5 [Solenopsis invicta]